MIQHIQKYLAIRSHLLLFALVLAPVARSLAQSGYAELFIDFTDSINSRLLQEKTENLGSLLIDGYLKGKLRGYQQAYKKEELKWAPVPKEWLPERWNPKTYYFSGDRVFHNGHSYVMLEEIGPSRIPPDKSKKWVSNDVKGLAVSTKYSFPSIGDTLSKAAFLTNMISEFSGPTPRKWNPKSEYYTNEEVEYDGRVYVSISEVPPGIAPTDVTRWEKIHRSLLPQFLTPTAISAIRVLSHYEINGDTIWSPQMIELVVYNNARGGYDKTVVAFMFSEAIEYLNSVSQPLIFDARAGYGSIFAVSAKSLTPSPGSSSLIAPILLTYSQALLTNAFHDSHSIVKIDSLPPRKRYTQPLRQTPQECFLLEERKLSWSNEKERALVEGAWRMVMTGFRANTLQPVAGVCINCIVHDWSKEGTWGTAGKHLTEYEWLNLLNPDRVPGMDKVSPDSIAFAGLSIVYKRKFKLTQSDFEPVQVSLNGTRLGWDCTSSFNWKSIKETWSTINSLELNKLIVQIEQGKVNTGASSIVSGLRETEK